MWKHFLLFIILMNPFIFYCILQALYEAGVKRKGTDVSCWITILSERSVQHLQRGNVHLLCLSHAWIPALP